MNELEKFLADHIQNYGPVDIGQFMSIALGHPEHGYYMKKDPFGRGGDFTTAPEISQMFGEMIGAWAADIWMQMGKPASFSLLECGPGRGTLMADILRSTKTVEGFYAAADIHLLEMSPVLKEIQGKALHDAMWHQTLDTVPINQPMIVIANEFLDALPVRQFQKADRGWMERVVSFKGNCFEFGLTKSTLPLAPPQSGGASNDVFEMSPAIISFMQNLFAMMKNTTGAALFIDYGHIKPGFGDTVQAVHKHQYCPVLEHIGDADLTAHVDFAAIVDVAKKNDIHVHGPVEQGAFLKALGIVNRAVYLKAKSKNADDIEVALHRLTASDQMGVLFKVLGLSYGAVLHPAGF